VFERLWKYSDEQINAFLVMVATIYELSVLEKVMNEIDTSHQFV
jgi:hypothetical protein